MSPPLSSPPDSLPLATQTGRDTHTHTQSTLHSPVLSNTPGFSKPLSLCTCCSLWLHCPFPLLRWDIPTDSSRPGKSQKAQAHGLTTVGLHGTHAPVSGVLAPICDHPRLASLELGVGEGGLPYTGLLLLEATQQESAVVSALPFSFRKRMNKWDRWQPRRNRDRGYDKEAQ